MRVHQVLSIILDNPVTIARFDNSGSTAKVQITKAEELERALDKVGIEFAVVNHNPPLEILIASADLPKLKQAHIKLPTAFDKK